MAEVSAEKRAAARAKAFAGSEPAMTFDEARAKMLGYAIQRHEVNLDSPGGMAAEKQLCMAAMTVQRAYSAGVTIERGATKELDKELDKLFDKLFDEHEHVVRKGPTPAQRKLAVYDRKPVKYPKRRLSKP